MTATLAGRRYAGASPFYDQCALEFGERSHDMKHQLTSGRTGADRLVSQTKPQP